MLSKITSGITGIFLVSYFSFTLSKCGEWHTFLFWITASAVHVYGKKVLEICLLKYTIITLSLKERENQRNNLTNRKDKIRNHLVHSKKLKREWSIRLQFSIAFGVKQLIIYQVNTVFSRLLYEIFRELLLVCMNRSRPN